MAANVQNIILSTFNEFDLGAEIDDGVYDYRAFCVAFSFFCKKCLCSYQSFLFSWLCLVVEQFMFFTWHLKTAQCLLRISNKTYRLALHNLSIKLVFIWSKFLVHSIEMAVVKQLFIMSYDRYEWKIQYAQKVFTCNRCLIDLIMKFIKINATLLFDDPVLKMKRPSS